VAQPPVVSIENPLPGSTFDEGVPIPLQGRVVDEAFSDQLDSIAAVWAVNGARVCPDAVFDSGGITTCDTTFVASDATTITLTATDPEGQTATASVEVVVATNAAPTAEILAPDPSGGFYSDTPIVFEALVADAEDSPDLLTAVWEDSVDGLLDLDGTPTSAGQLSGSTTLSSGSHFVTLTVTDTSGRTGEATVSVEVSGPNNLPDCQITAPESGTTSGIGDTILFEAVATDADIPANLLTVTWTSDKDGLIGTSTASSSGNVFFGYSDLSVNTHTITLEVADEVGALCNDAILVQVGNAPQVTLTTPTSGGSVNQGERVEFSATVSDAEDPPTLLDLVWESSVDGVISTQGANSSGVSAFSYADLSPGTHTLTVTATDSDGFYGLDRATVYVNGLPTTPGVELTPDPATSGDTLVASVTTASTDPDGDPLTYVYEWYRDGILTAYTTSTINSTAHARGEIWEVRVYADDGVGRSSPGSDSTTIVNGAPSITSVTISPSPAYTNDTLSAVVSGWSDPDGDAESHRYQWYVNSSAVASATDATLTGGFFARGDSVTVEVTPWDGATTGTTVTSGARLIQNSVPTTPGIGITPTLPEDDDSFTCAITTASTDDDADTVSYTYAWTRNGVATGITSGTVDPSYTSDGDLWQCSVTPSDGTDAGTPATASVEVNDHTAPSPPVLTGIDPYRNEDSVTVAGVAEAAATIVLYRETSSGTTTSSTTASGAGTFSFTITGMTRADTYTFYATAADAEGNTSGPSNEVSTEACDPWDEYEDAAGYGDSCADPVVDWASLDDSGSASISIVGNILDGSDTDWYQVDTTDTLTAGINYYRFRVQMVDGTSDYRITVYEGGCSSAYLDCSSSGYTEYEYYAYDSNDSGHGTPSDTRYCNYGSWPYYNNCDDLSSTYYIRVTRTSSAYDCDPYELEVTNGVW